MQQNRKKSAQKRNWRLKKANKTKREMVLRRKREIEDSIEKKSLAYREKMLQKDCKQREIQKKSRKLMILMNIELLIRFLFKISAEGFFFFFKITRIYKIEYLGLKNHKTMFKFNMKARIIQMAWRKKKVNV